MIHDNLSPPAIACFISPHGFGHAARTVAVLLELQRLRACKVVLITSVPQWFFRESLPAGFLFHSFETDIGLVQSSALQEDMEATLRRLTAFYPPAPETVALLQHLLRDCSLALCDIAPLGILTARAAGIPSVLLENFTWDWIYQGYREHQKQFAPIIKYLEETFASADYHIHAEPVCAVRQCDLVTPPIFREIRVRPETIRQRLGIAPEHHVVLVTMGGIGEDDMDLSRLRKQKNFSFLLPGTAETIRCEENLRLLPRNSGFYHPDLVGASDIVIGKVGYSTLAEVYQADCVWGYISRPRFPEAEPLARFIRSNMQGCHIPAAHFKQADWVAELPALLSLHRQPSRPRKNGAITAAKFLAELL